MDASTSDAGATPNPIATAFDALAPTWDACHGRRSLRRMGFALRARLLAAVLRDRPVPGRVLDIGCGTGQYLLALTPWIEAGIGIDIAPAMIERARRHARAAGLAAQLRFDVAPAAELVTWRHVRFDVAMFLGSLEHLPDPAVAIADVASLLLPGGLLVVLILQPDHPLGRLAVRRMRRGTIPPLRLAEPGTVRSWAREAGLAPVPQVDCGLQSFSWMIYSKLNSFLVGRQFLVFRKDEESVSSPEPALLPSAEHPARSSQHRGRR